MSGLLNSTGAVSGILGSSVLPSGVTGGSGLDETPLSNRNMIINGGMTVWQRGRAAVAVSSGYSTVDRWAVYESSDAITTLEHHTMTLSELNTTGHRSALKMIATQVDTTSANASYIFLRTTLEGKDCQRLQYGTANAKTMTLSFWCMSDKTGIYSVTINKGDTTRYMCPIQFSISSADTWEFKEIVITPTMGGTSLITGSGGIINNINTAGLSINFTLLVGNDYEATADTWVASSTAWGLNAQVNWAENVNNNFYLTGVQLELGSVATTFEHRTYGDDLARCQRYCYRSDTPQDGTTATSGNMPRAVSSTLTSTGNHRTSVFFPSTMRDKPSSMTLTASEWGMTSGNTTYAWANANLSSWFKSNEAAWLEGTCDSGGTAHGLFFPLAEETTGYMLFECEL